VVVVLCNCRPDQAEPLARALVEARVAACVNVIPGVTSVYRWQGDVCVDAESTLLIKTPRDRVAALSDRIRALHAYELPEILVLDIDVAGSDPRYVRWVRDVTREEEGP
jgi:periplasmic divalent cation tolerance protein